MAISSMANLDSPDEIKKLDSKNLAGSIEALGKQCQQVFEEVAQISFDASLGQASRIVVMGMGGSALGTHVVQSLYFNELKVPLAFVNGYHVGGWVDPQTLVILSSYSGTTEEVLAAYGEAKSRGAKLLIIASGGDLGKLMEQGEIGGYVFEPKYNPSGQPRMGLGYSILGQVMILAKLGYLNFGKEDLEVVLAVVDKVNAQSGLDVTTTNNKAKQTAARLANKVPFLLASEHLVGNIHTFANQINENAKVISAYFTLPEADHHLIEGLPATDEIHRQVEFFFLKSNLYSPRVLQRYEITKTLVEKNGFKAVVFEPETKTKLEQVFEFLTLGSWVSFYLAMLYGRDPAPIPSVDFLKGQMAKE